MTPIRTSKNGRVSVIVPAFNRAASLPSAIASVRAQTAADVCDIYVVDDGSTDDTPRVAEQLADCMTYIRQDNAGAAAARNAGLIAQSNEFVAFLDSDDAWLPNKIEAQLAAMREHANAAFVCGNYVRVQPGGEESKSHTPPIPHDTPTDVLPALLEDNFVATSVTMVRAAALARTGLFHSALRRSQDYHLWLRLAAIGPAVYLSEPLMRYALESPGCLSAGSIRQATYQLRARHLFRSRLRRRPDCRAAWRRGLAANLALLRDAAYRRGDFSAAARYGLQTVVHQPIGRARWEWFRPIDAVLRSITSATISPSVSTVNA